MKILIDTNVLLRLGSAGCETHSEAVAAVDWLTGNGYECVLVPQVVYEFWVVATRPVESKGLGLIPQKVDLAISEWLASFPLLLDEPEVFRVWRELVRQHEVKGKLAHDTRLVAAMQSQAISHLLTFNHQDFVRFGSINVVTPNDIQTGKLPARTVHGGMHD